MEIVCPACGAKYRLPDGAIGAAGRSVACSACGNRWHAIPEPVAEPGQPEPAPIRPEPTTIRTEPPATEAPAPGWPPEPTDETEYKVFDDDNTDSARPETPASGERPGAWTGQMAEIRQMLDEVQSSTPEETRPADAPTSERTQVLPDTDPFGRSTDHEYVDPLREKLAQHTAGAAARPSRSRNRKDDRRSLMRQHNRKMRRRRARDAAGTGAFMTGFLLLVIIAAAMIALYKLKDPIVTAQPQLTGAMETYVATVDTAHQSVVESFGNMRTWIVETFKDKV